MDPLVPVQSRFPVGVRDDGKLLLIIPTRFVRWNFAGDSKEQLSDIPYFSPRRGLLLIL
jgi:hypothetical protein